MNCAYIRELAPEFALGVLGGEARAEVLEHIDRCAACRTFVGELSEATDALLTVAPEMEPPPGFERTALRGMTRRRRVSWRAAGAVAAAAAIGAILSITAIRLVESDETTVPQANRSLLQAHMIGAGGIDAGRAYVHTGPPSWVVVSMNYGVTPGKYHVQLVDTDGARADVGVVRLDGASITWGGASAFPGDRVAAVRIVDAKGHAVCSATFASP